MGKIYYMMGKSSSGKDTLYGMLMKDEKLRLKTVVPYTTRPMRAGEENGVSYYFCDEDAVELNGTPLSCAITDSSRFLASLNNV